jgi:hypothetical protein
MLRDPFNAPIVDYGDAGGSRVRAAGLWFSPEEILALMSMYRILEGTDESGLAGFKKLLPTRVNTQPPHLSSVRTSRRSRHQATAKAKTLKSGYVDRPNRDG